MAVSFALRQALKHRKRSARRVDVAMFLFCVALGLWGGGYAAKMARSVGSFASHCGRITKGVNRLEVEEDAASEFAG